MFVIVYCQGRYIYSFHGKWKVYEISGIKDIK